MINLKKGFTLAELLISISVLILVTGLTIPVAKKILPESDREKAKVAYYQINTIIKSLTSDPYIYPTGRFNAPRDYINQQTGESYQRNCKFAKAFISRLNIIKVKYSLKYNEEWNQDRLCNTDCSSNITAKWNRLLGFSDSNTTTKRSMNRYDAVSNSNAENVTRACALTNNKVFYCLPQNTFNESRTNPSLVSNANTDRFYGDGSIIIKVYFSDDHRIEKGYYFTVNGAGKVGILKESIVTCLGEKNACANSNPISCNENSVCSCKNKVIYEKYNQCKLYDYLAKAKGTK